MYNLIVTASGFLSGITDDRMLEYTREDIKKRFLSGNNTVDRRSLEQLPTLLVQEFRDRPDTPVHVGYFTYPGSEEIKQSPLVPVFPAKVLQDNLATFTMNEWENTRTHWAVKAGDLFQILGGLLSSQPDLKQLIETAPSERIIKNQIAVMMPFSSTYSDTYETIRQACAASGYEAKRVDDFFAPGSIPDQITNLIRNSAYVLADLSEQNRNVLYEVGYAQGASKTTILITSSDGSGIPFDINHLRHIHYLNNKEGRTELLEELSKAIKTLP